MSSVDVILSRVQADMQGTLLKSDIKPQRVMKAQRLSVMKMTEVYMTTGNNIFNFPQTVMFLVKVVFNKMGSTT